MCSLPDDVSGEYQDGNADGDCRRDLAVDHGDVERQAVQKQFADDDPEDRHQQRQKARDHAHEYARIEAARHSPAPVPPSRRSARRAGQPEFVDRGHDQTSVHPR